MPGRELCTAEIDALIALLKTEQSPRISLY